MNVETILRNKGRRVATIQPQASVKDTVLMLRANGVAVGKGGQSHFDLPSGLVYCGLAVVAPFGRRLDDLRGERTTSDYDLGKTINRPYAQTIVTSGRALIADFQALLGTVPARQITAGAKRYLQSVGHLP